MGKVTMALRDMVTDGISLILFNTADTLGTCSVCSFSTASSASCQVTLWATSFFFRCSPWTVFCQ
jgi:hypothetical protein